MISWRRVRLIQSIRGQRGRSCYASVGDPRSVDRAWRSTAFARTLARNCFIAEIDLAGSHGHLSGDGIQTGFGRKSAKFVLTCHRTFVQRQLESRGVLRRLARLEQRAIGGAGVSVRPTPPSRLSSRVRGLLVDGQIKEQCWRPCRDGQAVS